MDKVLVTGGTGFVGTWMKRTQPETISAHYWGRQDYKTSWLSHAHNFKYIVHAATVSPDRMISVARCYHARLLYVSSGIVYHPENDTEYRRNKIAWEQECLSSGVDCVIARLFTFSGDGLDDNKAIVQFERAAKEGKPLHIWRDGSCIRSYMHGEELGRCMWAILLRGQSGEAYDVGSDEPVTMLDLARRYSDNIVIEGGRDPMPVYLPPDAAKTKALLNGTSPTD